ncbi:PB1-F2 protein [Influenza A virus]
MEQGLGTQREGSGRQIQKLGLPSSTQLMDHYLRIWPFLKNPIQASLKTLALKQWKPFNRQG